MDTQAKAINNKKYGVIYADPPWKFKTYSHKGLGRSAEAWYDCMTLSEIYEFPVKDYAAKDCVLFLWVTDPFLQAGIEAIWSWGFKYKTVGFYWAKEPTSWYGTGYWSRANPEQCLLATCGSPKRLNADVPKLVMAERREHSRKPDEVRNRIMRLCKGPYLELFARERAEGWDSLGNENESGINQQRRWGASGHPVLEDYL